MMNRQQHIHAIRLLLFGGLLPVLVAACSADVIEPMVEKPVAVTFTSGFARVITRSTLDNEWSDATQIEVRCSEAGQDDKRFTYQYDASENTWTAVSTAGKYYWPINDPSWVFSAWPTSYGSSPIMTKTVAANQTVYDENSNPSGITEDIYEGYDLLYCPSTTATYRQPVTLNFLHQMARVKVIVNSSNTDTKDQVTSINFGDGHVGLEGHITTQATTTANATWALDDSQNSTIQMRNRTTTAEAATNVYTFECMVPPQSYTTNIITNLLYITTQYEDSGTQNRTYSFSGTYTFLSGNIYTYNLAISEEGKVTLLTVQVEPWADVENVNNTATIPNSYPNANVTEN